MNWNERGGIEWIKIIEGNGMNWNEKGGMEWIEMKEGKWNE